MNIFKHAVKACRSVSRSSRFTLRFNAAFASILDRLLLAIAHVLCVESHGVMTAGPSSASVVQLPHHRNTQ